MSFEKLRAGVIPGPGIVARFAAGIVVAAAPVGDAQDGFVNDLLAMTAAAAAGEGRKLVRRIAGAVASAEPEDVPSVGVLAPAAERYAVFAVGDIDVVLGMADGSSELISCADSASWVDRMVDGAIGTVVVAATGDTGTEADPRSDLLGGVTLGGGIVLESRTAPPAPTSVPQPRADVEAPAPTPVPITEPDPEVVAADPTPTAVPGQSLYDPETPPAQLAQAEPVGEPEFVSVALNEPLPDDEIVPLPMEGSLEPDPALPDHAMVEGIFCSREHFNDPGSVYCSVCGVSMVNQTHNLVRDVRPPLGVLVLDNGATFGLSMDVVIGREPDNDRAVVAGEALPLVLQDSQRTISRVHARVTLQGWNVRLSDAGSANGTFVSKSSDAQWHRLVADESVTISPGTRIQVGNIRLVFDSHHRQ